MGYLIRIDIPKNSSHGTHGWQARVNKGKDRKYHSKLFSDSHYGGSDKAKEAAKEYMEAYEKEHPSPFPRQANVPYHKGKLSSRNKSGVNGVCRTHDLSRRGQKTPYWGTFVPIGPNKKKFVKKFYVDVHGEDEAKRLAVEFRKMWEEAVDQGEEALMEFFDREHYDKLADDPFLS